jgi:ferredoxin-NADP reductase
MKLQYKETKPVTSSVNTFVFSPEEPVSWQAGQFMYYTLPHPDADDRGEKRWFTISSAPYQGDIWITTRITPDTGSSFKKALLSLQPGQTVEAEGPDGDFIVNDPAKRYIFVAGGIGITPFRSIINQLDHEGKDINIELLYANRDEADVPFREELEALSHKHENFNITYFFGDNLIDEAALREFGSRVDEPYYYVSGPEPMVEAFKATLDGMGVDEQHAQFDYFPGYKG